MESAEIRKLRAIDRIKQILKEEHCVVQSGITIIGTRIVDSQVIVNALPEPKEESIKAPEQAITAEEPAQQKEGGTS